MKKIIDSITLQNFFSFLKEKKIINFLLGANLCLALLLGAKFSAWATGEITPQAPVVQSERLYLETQIQGLYTPFKEEYKFLSPVMGLLALNSGMLSNLRFQGKYGAERAERLCHYQITHPAENHMPTSTVDCPQDSTSAVIQHFFPSPAGGLLIPPALNNIDLISRININDIGNLLKIYVQYIERLRSIENDPSQKPKIKGEFFEKFNTFFKDKLGSLKNDKKASEVLEQAWGKAGIKLEDLPQKYAEMFLEAVEERESYPAHTIEYALMAYAWKKSPDIALIASQIKSMANDKFKDFLLPSSSPRENVEGNIKRGKPSPEEIAARKQAAALQKQNKSAPFSAKLYSSLKDQAVKNNYLAPEEFQKWLEDPEKLIFMTLGYNVFENDYPSLLGMGDAIYQNISFPDCGESTLLNLFNILLADTGSKAFDVTSLTDAFPNARQSLVEFYKKYQPLYTSVGDTSNHRNLWAAAISGLSPQKVAYNSQVCNIQGAGIDNMLAVLEELLNDPALISIRENSIGETRAKKLSYIFEKLNKRITWLEKEQSKTLSDYPIITLLVNGKKRFLWKFQKGHFTFLSLEDSSSEKNWLLNGSEGGQLILNSSLSKDLKRLLLPFYHGEALYKAYENSIELQNSLKEYDGELFFGSPLAGKEQFLTSLDYLLTLDPESKKVKEWAIPCIRKMFIHRDTIDGDLTALLFKYGNIFKEESLAQDLGGEIATVYHNNLTELASFTPKGKELLLSYFNKSFYTEQLIIHTLLQWQTRTDITPIIADNKLFHKAAENGKGNVLKFLFEKFPRLATDPQLAKNDLKETPLHLAVNMGHLEIVKLLMEKAPDLIANPQLVKCNLGRTPLHLAVNKGNLEIVKLLIEKFPELITDVGLLKNDFQETPLHFAINKGHLEIVKLLVGKYPQLASVPGQNLLYKALEAGHISIAEFLLEKFPPLASEELLKKDSKGNTILHLVVDNGKFEMVKFLLEKSPRLATDPQLVKNNLGENPLHLAVNKGHLEIVKLLMEKAQNLITNPQLVKNNVGENPLHLAVNKGHLEIVKLLVEKYPQLASDPNLAKSASGQDPLYMAILEDKLAIAEFLLEKFPQLASEKMLEKKFSGETFLHLAIDDGDFEMVKFLLEKLPRLATDPQLVKNNVGENPLHLAVNKGHLEIVKLLVEKYPQLASDPNLAKSASGQDPLYMAILKNKLAIAEFLLEKFPQLGSEELLKKHSSGNTLLHLAAIDENVEMVKFLLEKFPRLATDPQLVKNNSGRTPLHYAVNGNHLEMVKLLVEKAPQLLMEKNNVGNLPRDLNSGVDIKTYLLEQEKIHFPGSTASSTTTLNPTQN